MKLRSLPLKKLIKGIGYFGFIILCTLLLLELCYRYQVIDFYKVELEQLNTQTNPELENVLVIGDSFSANPKGYIKHLRNRLDFNVINAAIPGTGIRQHELYFKDRVKAFKPKHIIYQIYTGNDFLDIKHPINFEKLSFTRNFYWLLSDRLLVLQHLNKKLVFFKKSDLPRIKKRVNQPFSKILYNQRVKTYFKGSKKYLYNTLFMQGDQKGIYTNWKKKLLKIRKSIPASIPITIVILPHCAQVSEKYQKRMQQLGAWLPDTVLSVNPPLYQQIEKDLEGIRILNPLDYFQKLEQNGHALYYENDPHLTLKGQEYLGQYLIKELKEPITL